MHDQLARDRHRRLQTGSLAAAAEQSQSSRHQHAANSAMRASPCHAGQRQQEAARGQRSQSSDQPQAQQQLSKAITVTIYSFGSY